MTDEQIKQNAEAYASTKEMHSPRSQDVELDKLMIIEDFIAGAHSRDEEIKGYQAQINITADALQQCIDELNQLRNQWISVEEQLPIENQDVLISHWNENVTRINRVSTGDINYMKEHPDLIKYWMLTPKIKRNESK